MGKLIELLNEYNGQDSYWLDEDSISKGKYINRGSGDQCFVNEHIISKRFGFIKRLVDNDKIDFEKYRIMDTRKYLHQHIIGNVCYVDIRADVPNYEFILALLSIQDNPIEFLCDIIK